MITISSPFLFLSIDSKTGKYELRSNNDQCVSITEANLAVSLRVKGKRVNSHSNNWQLSHTDKIETIETSSGLAKAAHLHYTLGKQDITCHVTFALLQDHPLLLLMMRLENQGNTPVFPEDITLCNILPGAFQIAGNNITDPVFFSNGWQSWSPSRAYHMGDKQQRTKLGFLSRPMIVNQGTPIPRTKNHFSSDMYALLADFQSKQGLVAGFLSQKQHFGSLETHFLPAPSLKIWANGDQARVDPGMSIETDWLALSFTKIDNDNPFATYLGAVNRENQVRLPKEVPFGWCSWYYYFTNLKAEDILKNLNQIKAFQEELPLKLIQIDDGFEKSVGDWFEFNEKFSKGVKPLAKEIQANDLTPGLWLAPFIIERGAKVCKEHPNWLLRNRFGFPVNAGFGWNKLTTALDLTNPEALAYACDVVRTAVHTWGFPYIKLDFLYAAACRGQYQDPTKTRAQVLRAGLEALRQAAGDDTTMLACGCPLGPAIGLFETMRISADVGPSWQPEFLGISKPFLQEPNMPCARNAIQNILTRVHLDKYMWVNDPDCLLIRTDSNLTLPEVQSLTSAIALTGGSVLLSDNLSALPKERLDIAKLLVPVITSPCKVIDLFDKHLPENLSVDLESPAGTWKLIAMFNWQDKKHSRIFDFKYWDLDPRLQYIAREIWTGKIDVLQNSLCIEDIPAHGVKLFAVREYSNDQANYVGSNLHISQGLELLEWQVKENEIFCLMALPRKVKGEIFLYLPNTPSVIMQGDMQIPYKEIGFNLYAVPVMFIKETQLRIKFT